MRQGQLSRRSFLARAGMTAGAVGLGMNPATASARKRARSRALHTGVAVLGGGVGGLTAAHELAERGFAVTVIEPRELGGKARSMGVPDSGTGGRHDLPGEHGFRFFPGFYQNIPDTMSRIPCGTNPHGVRDNLVDAHQEQFAFGGQTGSLYLPPAQNPHGIDQLRETILTAFKVFSQIPPNEAEYFVRKLLVYMTSSDERRFGEWEYVSWSDFVKANEFSEGYRKFLGGGLTRTLVAAKGDKASTRTIGLMAEAFVYAIIAQGTNGAISGYGAADRVLDAPTNEAWIDPWVAHLKSLGVKFVVGAGAKGLKLRNERVVSATLTDGSQITADWFVAAMPVERAVQVFDARVRAADPRLARLDRLEVDWMNGIQFYLSRSPANPVDGHVAYFDAPWALTSLTQGQFWNGRVMSRDYGDGRVNDILSVDISDWETPGIVYGKAAKDLTPDQVAHDVWEQIKRSINNSSDTEISDDMLLSWWLDPGVTYPNGPAGGAVSVDPLLINTVGSYDNRPDSDTAIENLFLASDYVRVNVDLATMEGANEAARQAVNALLDRSGSKQSPCKLFTLYKDPALQQAKNADAELYKRGQPNALDVLPAAVPA
jgi:uncharacterized protein with NAD-binding domain and iron-sulfur cluster